MKLEIWARFPAYKLAFDVTALRVKLPYSGLAGPGFRLSTSAAITDRIPSLTQLPLQGPWALAQWKLFFLVNPRHLTIFLLFRGNQEAGLTLPVLKSPTPHSTPLWLLQLLLRWTPSLSIIRIACRVIKLL